MPTTIHWVPTNTEGRLGMMPGPKGGDALGHEIARWQAEGVDIVVSALEKDEEAALYLADEGALCGRAGIEFRSLPIPDFGLPHDPDTFIAGVDELHADLTAGKCIAVHCFAGIGRTGMITGGTLVRCGHTVKEAFEVASLARGMTVPNTLEQAQWVARHFEP